jgi:DHA2 family multidrug resistance protein
MNNETAAMLLTLDAEINRQAATIAYINDFKLMMWIVLAVIPLVYFIKAKPPSAPANESTSG